MFHRTARLVLRGYVDEDRAPLAALCADPRVMEHFPKTLTREESDGLFDRLVQHLEKHDFGFYAVEVGGCFAGFCGLANVPFDAWFTVEKPCVEIGWRLAVQFQGRGYATEAAQACVSFARDGLRLPKLWSFTVEKNRPSRHVMEKLGMRQIEGFVHPKLPEHMNPAVLYRLDF